jgi:hypothetical protein
MTPTDLFLEKFGAPDPVAGHNLRCEMVARAIKAIGDSSKVTHTGGSCWRYPKTNKDGYGYTHVLSKSRITSRLVLCCATDKPYDYHNEHGDYMIASHRTPIICRFRDCLNPDHLFWETLSDGCERREVEARAADATRELALGLSAPSPVH